MPKQSVELNRFEGGLNNNSADRDLLVNELKDIKNLTIRTIGKLITVPDVISGNKVFVTYNTLDSIYEKYGFLLFGLDVSVGSGSKKYYGICYKNSLGLFNVDFFEDDGTRVPIKEIDLSAEKSMVINGVENDLHTPVVLNFEGNPIVLDGNKDMANSIAKMLVYVDRWYFSTSSGFRYTAWREEKLLPDLPIYDTNDTQRTVHALVGTALIGSAEWRIVMEIASSGTGTWDGNYNIYASYILEDGTESGLTKVGSTSGLASGVGINVTVKVYRSVNYWANSREVGIAFYIKKDGEDDYWFFAEARYEADKGLHVNGYNDGEYVNWVYGSPTFDTTYNGILDPIKNITYEMRNNTKPFKKISQGSAGGYFWAKTVAVGNRRVYYGNVSYKDRNGTLKTKEDWILKSEVGRPGSIDSEYSVLEVTTNDGEEIKKLEFFANRLLQFKERTLYIINVSRNIEYLEATKDGMGIDNPNQTVATEFGIVWFNANGVYLYNGRGIAELLIKENRRLISFESWNKFYTASSYVLYDMIRKEVYFLKESGSVVSGFGYSFDTNSFFRVENVFASLVGGTNIQVGYDLKATFLKVFDDAGTNKLMDYYVDKQTSGTVQIVLETKDFTFTNDSDLKNINSILLTFVPSKSIGGTVDLTLSYRTNGNSAWVQVNQYIDGGATQVTKKEDLFIKNIRSIQFKLEGTVPVDFELNNISIILRIKKGR